VNQAGYNPDNVQERKLETLQATGKEGEGVDNVTYARKSKIRGGVSGLEFAFGPDIVAEAEAITRDAAEFRNHDLVTEAEAITHDAAQFKQHNIVAEAEAITRDAAKRKAEAQAYVNEYAVQGSATPYAPLQPQSEGIPADSQQDHMESIYRQIDQIRAQQTGGDNDNFALGA
jgi:hypothetical protein